MLLGGCQWGWRHVDHRDISSNRPCQGSWHMLRATPHTIWPGHQHLLQYTLYHIWGWVVDVAAWTPFLYLEQRLLTSSGSCNSLALVHYRHIYTVFINRKKSSNMQDLGGNRGKITFQWCIIIILKIRQIQMAIWVKIWRAQKSKIMMVCGEKCKIT